MEREFLQFCKDGDVDKVSLLLKEKRVSVNTVDADGMSGLMHAAYNGHSQMCSLLIEQGADVDVETIKDYYTALMMATLAGRCEVVELLLRAGANPDRRTKLNKNAANLAAFVGSKECLRIINNFLPLSEVTYHTVPRGMDESDFLAPEHAAHVHYLCCMNNLNPVKMLLYIKEHPALADPANKLQVTRTFDRLIDKQFQVVINEVMAFKIHYIVCLMEEVYKRGGGVDGIDGAIKHFLLGRQVDGFPINVEQLVRRAIRSFKFVKSQLVSQLVRTLAPITPGAGKPALYFVMTTLNGRHVDVDEFACRTCGEMRAEKRCSACKQVFYCNATCQKMHWFTHKKVCEGLSKRKPKCQPNEEADNMILNQPSVLPPQQQNLQKQQFQQHQFMPPPNMQQVPRSQDQFTAPAPPPPLPQQHMSQHYMKQPVIKQQQQQPIQPYQMPTDNTSPLLSSAATPLPPQQQHMAVKHENHDSNGLGDHHGSDYGMLDPTNPVDMSGGNMGPLSGGLGVSGGGGVLADQLILPSSEPGMVVKEEVLDSNISAPS